jgi:hypothetical protein
MTHEQLCNYIQQNTFIDREEWAKILQNAEDDIMVDYEEVVEPWVIQQS